MTASVSCRSNGSAQRAVGAGLAFGLSAMVGLAVIGSPSALAAPVPSPSCDAGVCTVSFAETGDVQRWTVPSGVESLTLDVTGAAGGSAASTYDRWFGSGGVGGQLQETVPVTAGDSLAIVVGAPGADGQISDTNAPAQGGFGGGGNAGTETDPVIFPGGAGGGGSFVFDTTASTLIAAAGGGGGGSAGKGPDDGGAGGGGDAGVTPTPGFYESSGTGATTTGPGAGGEAAGNNGVAGSSGSAKPAVDASDLGMGGDGALHPDGSRYGTGGGGGGGYYGGGGGGTDGPGGFSGPGGGGSGYQATNATDVTIENGPPDVSDPSDGSISTGPVAVKNPIGRLPISKNPGAPVTTTTPGAAGSVVITYRQSEPTVTTLSVAKAKGGYLLTSSVSAGKDPAPDGYVTFMDGTVVLGRVAAVDGIATLAVAVSPGTHAFTAAFGGGPGLEDSSSAPVALTVTVPPVTPSPTATPTHTPTPTPTPVAPSPQADAALPLAVATTPPAPTLADTGTKLEPVFLLGIGLLGIGTGILAIGRRARRTQA